MSIICQREPKRLEIHLYYRTTGLPKGRKVLGDGVVILAAHMSTSLKKAKVSKDTNTVMGVEREVLQPYIPSANKCLETGMKKLVALGELSDPKTQKVKV